MISRFVLSDNQLLSVYLVGALGFEPKTCRLKAECSTTELYSHLVVDAGFEPATYRLSSECSTTELIDHHLLVIEYPPTNSPVFRITKDQRALPLISCRSRLI